MSTIGVIAIGRNEGERLQWCLASVVNRGMPVVYVDSRSTDGSAELAFSMGAEVVDLDMSIPFSAARARNEGFDRLMRTAPDTRFVFFVDGDCEVVAGWIDQAVSGIDPKAAVICGRRRERYPEKSIYNRLADIEWDTPLGDVKSCGGDSIMRVEAFKQAGGYDRTVVAGEEPELCQRMRDQGWKIQRIDAEMTVHDSAMYHFGQWWRRTVRSGYGGLDVATRFRRGPDGLFVKQIRSARTWGLGFPAAVLAAFFITCVVLTLPSFGGMRNGPNAVAIGGLVAFAVAAVLPLQMLRLAMTVRSRTPNLRTAVAYGVLTMIAKWANVVGQVRYLRDRRAGRNTRLIDYKGNPTLHSAPQ